MPFTFDYTFDANGHPENIYCRSDHYNYARYGIPVVFLTTGLHGDYHQVTDEPQYIDYPHMARVGRFVFDLDAPRRRPRSPAGGGQAEAGSDGQPAASRRRRPLRQRVRSPPTS